VDLTLNNCSLKCLHCGAYDNYSGVPPTIKANEKKISGNLAIGSFKFVGDVPEHLQKNGKLCIPCLELLKSQGIIENDNPKSRSEYDIWECALCRDGGDILTRLTSSKSIDMLDGIYELNLPSNIELPIVICNECIKPYLGRPVYNMACDSCAKLFVARDVDCTYSYDLPGILSEECLRVKEKVYNWTSGLMPARYKKAKNICLECVDKLVQDGTVIFKESRHGPMGFW
jgi:hypothetical protein